MSFKMFFSYVIVFIVGMFVSTLFDFGEQSSNYSIDPLELSQQSDHHNNDQAVTSNESYIDSLQKMIAEYQAKLSSLEEDNQSLINDLIDSEGKLLATATKPTISKRINAMSDEEIYEKIGEVFKERYLENVDNPKAFAQRLTDIALSDEDEQSISENGIANSEVRISISQFPGYQEMTSDQLVVSQYRRLYVNMISSLPVPNGLIKWKSLTDEKVIMFRGLSFHSKNDSQYVWGIPKSEDGWQPGVYQVSIYQINNELTLLASKTYTVSEVIDEGPEQTPDVPQHDGPPIKMQRQ